MTIDEALNHLHTYSSTMGSGQTTQEQHNESKRVAIDAMRKYQKIQEVMDSRLDDDAKTNSKALGEIEVIMYGN